ncbi:hypothetical protein DCO48_02910 [Pseudomonas sp. SDI]|uniref:hypothetical protein n=1 Tax=Pseudomonas sp. SDI TaxID=2170734 RepID=UPI000DE6DE16|nr:hypothetical protein [Pseudomonas sp. SDI]PWB35387.1 hypothetical protein DCO48_02910 [Pseudomonas sp. SDI]
MKSVYLINNVQSGGKTYLEYLLPALNALRHEYNCIVLNTRLTGLTKEDAEQTLNYPVQDVELDYIVHLKSEIIISNDAFIGRALDESNFAVFISHGNVGMPIKDKHYAASLMSFFDAIVSPSRSFFALLKKGLQLYRQERHVDLAFSMQAVRSDLRKTSVISTLPVKIPDVLSAPPAFNRSPDKYVVGILPTQKGICASGASLFENMIDVINAVKAQVPRASILLRPYMTDFEHPYIAEMCEKLDQYPWITIDKTRSRSEVFYQQCDTIITDASSGGVSFMLNTCRLPIYYVPADNASHPIVNAWLEQMDGYLPIAKNGDELKDLLHGFELLSPEQHYAIYRKFYAAEFGGFQHPENVFLDLVKKQHDSEFSYFAMAANGDVDSQRAAPRVTA